ncbi:MAG: glycosylhydrolase-like jelly roll fold domain-containing protein [Limisphaerales bacterium]
MEKNSATIFAASSTPDFDDAIELSVVGKQIHLRTTEPGNYSVKETDGVAGKVEIGALPPPQILADGWTLHAKPKELNSTNTHPVLLDSLKSWTEFSDPAIKYFSGTFAYARDVEIAPEQLEKNRQLWLDLGDVREIAQVELNGKNLGILWKPPFSVDIRRAAKPGANQLVVRVTNFWPNRIIGDQFLPENERVTRTNIRQLTKSTPLMPSGLLGPVRLTTVADQEIQFSK